MLDLTRVLAGPVATRFLAGFGADVLRIDPPEWDEPAVVPEVTLGKRCARLDARTDDGRAHLRRLLAEADVLVHGYRPGVLDSLLGVDADGRAELRPGLVEVCLDAYGWTGPWSARRGFDSLVQMSSGIAEAGMRWAGRDVPTPLPVQALDHATGYLMAAEVIDGLRGEVGDRPRFGEPGVAGEDGRVADGVAGRGRRHPVARDAVGRGDGGGDAVGCCSSAASARHHRRYPDALGPIGVDARIGRAPLVTGCRRAADGQAAARVRRSSGSARRNAPSASLSTVPAAPGVRLSTRLPITARVMSAAAWVPTAIRRPGFNSHG